MNISFKGTSRESGVHELKTINGNLGFYYKFICTLDDEGVKDLQEFKTTLQEFPYSKNKSKNNVLVIEIFKKVDAEDIPEVIKNADLFLKNKYNPKNDSFTLNWKPLDQSENKSYIFENIQALLDRIKSKRDIYFAFVDDYIQSRECNENLLGEYFEEGYELSREEMLKYHSPKNVKMVADECSKSFGNAIERLKLPNPRLLRR